MRWCKSWLKLKSIQGLILVISAPSPVTRLCGMKESEIRDRLTAFVKTPVERMRQEKAKTRAQHRDSAPVTEEVYRIGHQEGGGDGNMIQPLRMRR